METGRARGISLWLMPEGAARDRLTGLIERLAVRLGTRPFAAHVTLLAGLGGPEEGILRTAALLAATVRPLRVRLAAVEGRDEHFRCLVALAVPDEPLRAAHTAASRAFGREPDPLFLPHLSLVYGMLRPEVKRSLVAEVAAEAAASFVAGSLHVWRTQGPVERWCEIGAFGLSVSAMYDHARPQVVGRGEEGGSCSSGSPSPARESHPTPFPGAGGGPSPAPSRAGYWRLGRRRGNPGRSPCSAPGSSRSCVSTGLSSRTSTRTGSSIPTRTGAVRWASGSTTWSPG